MKKKNEFSHTAHTTPPHAEMARGCGPREVGLQRETARGGGIPRAGVYAKVASNFFQITTKY